MRRAMRSALHFDLSLTSWATSISRFMPGSLRTRAAIALTYGSTVENLHSLWDTVLVELECRQGPLLELLEVWMCVCVVACEVSFSGCGKPFCFCGVSR